MIGRVIFKSPFRIIRSPSHTVKRRSTTTTSEPTDEEKAAVVGQGMRSFAKKYGIIIFPTLFFTTLTVDVVNNVSHREWVEERWPFYVKIVRDKYGFDDEDEVDRLRMKAIRRHYANSLLLDLNSDEAKTSISVPNGMTKLEDVVLNVPQSTYSAKTIKDIYCTNWISFPDNEIINNAEIQQQDEKEFDEDPRSENVLNDSWQRNSLWDSEIFTNRAISEPTAFCLSKYENIAKEFFSGISLYKRYGNMAIIPQLGNEKDASQAHARRKMHKDNFDDKKILRNIALEKIKRLEWEIQELNKEKRIGFKDIDTIDHEIKRRNDEINQLRRSYVNLFYYF